MKRALAMLAIMGALGVMASLPGEARQEGRWLHPVATLAGLLALCARQVVVRLALRGDALQLLVVDDGRGCELGAAFSAASSGQATGMSSMRAISSTGSSPR